MLGTASTGYMPDPGVLNDRPPGCPRDSAFIVTALALEELTLRLEAYGELADTFHPAFGPEVAPKRAQPLPLFLSCEPFVAVESVIGHLWPPNRGPFRTWLSIGHICEGRTRGHARRCIRRPSANSPGHQTTHHIRPPPRLLHYSRRASPSFSPRPGRPNTLREILRAAWFCTVRGVFPYLTSGKNVL